MLTLSEAQTAICADIRAAKDFEYVALDQACNRFVADSIVAFVDNPAFDNSAMDGYALRVADLEGNGYALPLQGESRCGDAPGVLTPGTTMRIFTGAPLPNGADAVEIQENIQNEQGKVAFPTDIKWDQNIRHKGEDYKSGEILFKKGHRILPMDLGLLSSAGISKVPVFRRPRALVIATGDELVAPGMTLKPGQIYESNKLVTLSQLEALGVEAVDGGNVQDDPQVLLECLASTFEYDFVITSGGASVGDHDVVKQVFSEIGSINFWRVKIKPGKPVAFGVIGEHTHFFALPGNPMSSLVTFKLFVEPAIYAWNHDIFQQLELNAIAANDYRRSPGRMEFLRARLFTEHGKLMAEVLPGQGSHMLGTLRYTNGLIKVAEDSEYFHQGDVVTAIPLRLNFN